MTRRYYPSITTATRAANTPQEREYLYDTDENRPYAGDGVTLGARAMAYWTEPATTFASADATPSVKNGSAFVTAGATAITNFDDGTANQVITVYRGDSDIVITDNANIDPLIAGNITLTAANPSVSFRLVSGVWKEVSSRLSSTVIASGATTARTLADRFADALTPKDFGAVGDGVTNDYAAIAAAIAAADAENSGGGLVRFPAGIYAVGTEISVPAGVMLIGDGAQGTIIKPSASMTAVINMTAGLTCVEGMQIANASGYATSGIRVTKSANDFPARIAHNYIASFTNGILWSSGDHPQIDANTFNSNTTNIKIAEDGRNGFVDSNYALGGHGVDIAFATQQCEGLRITNNTLLPVSSNAHGIKITGGLKLHIGHNIIDQVGSGGNGIWLNGTSSVSRVSIEGNWVDGGASGVSLKTNGNVTQVKSKGNTYSGETGTVGIDADGLSRSQFTLDDTHDVTGKAYEFTSCTQIAIVGCDFDVGAQGTEDSGCSIYWAGTDGVPASRSSSSVYARNFNDAAGQQLGTPASGLLTACTGLPVRQVMTLTANGVLNAATTQYIGGGISSGEASINIIAPFDLTLKLIYAKQSIAPSAGQSVVYTVRANGSDTALTCTIADAATTANASNAGIAVSAGQIISVKVVSSATAAATVPAVTLGYEATSS